MLTIVKKYIEALPDTSFEQFYVNYIMQVQDENIEREMEYLSSKNILNIPAMENSIVKEIERLKDEIF